MQFAGGFWKAAGVFGVLAAGWVSCRFPAAATGVASGGQASATGSGIEGEVVKLKGNFMPGPGSSGGVRAPLSVPVHVFHGRVRVFDVPDPLHPALHRTLQADAEGRFRCALPPGEYTVVAEIDGKLYLNIHTFDGKDAYWATVEVRKGGWTAVRIEDTTEAAF